MGRGAGSDEDWLLLLVVLCRGVVEFGLEWLRKSRFETNAANGQGNSLASGASGESNSSSEKKSQCRYFISN